MDVQSKKLAGECDKNFTVLPVELKLEVIEKIPLNFRWDLAATSQELYELICDVDKFKHKLVLSPERVSKILPLNFTFTVKF